jgi:hypothetical protein
MTVCVLRSESHSLNPKVPETNETKRSAKSRMSRVSPHRHGSPSPLTTPLNGVLPAAAASTASNSPMKSASQLAAGSSAGNASQLATAAAAAAPSPSADAIAPLVITPRTIVMFVLKFLFVCANVAFAIYASKVVFCSTFFVSQPTAWLDSAALMNPQQRELAALTSFGSRFAYCVVNF